jgi:hypothetical protein
VYAGVSPVQVIHAQCYATISLRDNTKFKSPILQSHPMLMLMACHIDRISDCSIVKPRCSTETQALSSSKEMKQEVHLQKFTM